MAVSFAFSAMCCSEAEQRDGLVPKLTAWNTTDAEHLLPAKHVRAIRTDPASGGRLADWLWSIRGSKLGGSGRVRVRRKIAAPRGLQSNNRHSEAAQYWRKDLSKDTQSD